APGWRHNFHKLASAEIAEELRWLGTGNVAQTRFIDHMAVHHEQILKAIQVCIKEKQPERHRPQRRSANTSPGRYFRIEFRMVDVPLPYPAVQRGGFANKVADGNAELPVIGGIGSVNAHTGIGSPTGVEHQARLHTDFFKRPIAPIAVEQTG